MDVRTQPLIAQQGNIRVEPFAQPASTQLPPSMARTLGKSGAGGSGQEELQSNFDPNSIKIDEPFEFTPEEVAHLQQAAASGDKESFDLLNALKIPLGVAAGAAALYGGTRGALSLVDAYGKMKGMEMVPSGRTGGNTKSSVPPEPQRLLTNERGQQLLPAPQGKITDTTGTRFQQGTDVQSPKMIPDMNKTGREVDAAYAQRDVQDAAENEQG
jgi:hypothetical protein